MRGDPGPDGDAWPESLTASRAEIRTHPEHEGGYFGDLFSATPAAYVCVEPGHGARAAQQEAMQRVCTHPTGQTSADGLPVSRCGFIIVEGCGGGAGVDAGGRHWTEIIHVYLPGAAPALGWGCEMKCPSAQTFGPRA